MRRSPVLVSDESIPCRNPSFVRRDQDVYFSIAGQRTARRPTANLDGQAGALFDAIDGVRNLADLSRQFPQAQESIRQWDQLGVIELVLPRPPISPPRRVLVVEPHMDDAALSLGGTLLHLRGRAEVCIVSVTGRSKATSYSDTTEWDYFDLESISQLRLEESRLACRVLQAEFLTLGEEDLPVIMRSGARPWTMVPKREIQATVSGLFRVACDFEPTEVWVPLGIRHPDHVRVRKAALLMFKQNRERFSGVSMRFYQDLPYAAEVGPAAVQWLRDSLVVRPEDLRTCVEDVTDVMEAKVRLSRVYASQFKASVMGPKLVRAAHMAAGRGDVCHEISYEPCGELRDPIPEFDAGPAMRRYRHVRKVNALETTGWDPLTWKRLGAYFERAEIDVYIPVRHVPDSNVGRGERFNVRPVKGLGGWVKALFALPAPWRCLCIVPAEIRLRPGARGFYFRGFLRLWPFPVLACGVGGAAEWIEYQPQGPSSSEPVPGQ